MDWIADQFPRTINGCELGLWALGYVAWRALTAPHSVRRGARAQRAAEPQVQRQARRVAHASSGARWAERCEVLAKTRRALPERTAAERPLKRAA